MMPTQSYSEVFHLVSSLPVNEQEMLLYAIADNIRRINADQAVRSRLKAYVEGGIDEIASGRSFSNEEVLEFASRLIDQREPIAV
ncbi:MAG: hypothetical protein IJ621_07085 [Paludibacteraceae bacterium]|nr:hypothetical protein [Paludibacteraceae bacterium]